MRLTCTFSISRGLPGVRGDAVDNGVVTTDLGAPAQTHRRPQKRPTVGDRIRFVFEVIGELLITFGIVVLLFAVYELKVTDIRAAATQRGLSSELQRNWAGSTPTRPNGPDPLVQPVKGQPFAEIRMPRLGADYTRVVVEGVDHDDLKKGPGHYPGTTLPGQIGNTVISGHRTTYGAPFSNLDKLRPGDVVDIQVRYRTYHYRVTGTRIVSPDQRSVLLPVPDRPGVVPSDRILTMTTCNPKYSAAQRMVVFAAMRPGDYTDATRG
jgi:sortase A